MLVTSGGFTRKGAQFQPPNTQARNVVRRPVNIAEQQRRYARGPNSRTIVSVFRKISLLVMTPLIAMPV